MANARANLGQLTKLRDRLRKLKGPEIKTALAQRLCATAVKLVADEFRKSQNPYGEPWAPVVRNRLKDRRARARRAKAGRKVRADKPLIDTGRLRASVAAYPTDTGLRVVLPVKYSVFHQDGTRRIKRRQILPDSRLGPIWSRALEREARKALAELAGKAMR